MPHYKLLFPNEFVGAWDLEANGEKTVTIEAIKIEELHNADRGSKGEKKPVLSFKGAKKRLVLNKTNAATIADMYGTNTDKWIGKAVTLYATTCSSFGKTTECIRVRPEKPAGGRSAKVDYDPSTGEVRSPKDQAIDNSEPGQTSLGV